MVRLPRSFVNTTPLVSQWTQSLTSRAYRDENATLIARTDHFYLRTGANAATDEITFYCSSDACRLKSFVDTVAEQSASPVLDSLLSPSRRTGLHSIESCRRVRIRDDDLETLDD